MPKNFSISLQLSLGTVVCLSGNSVFAQQRDLTWRGDLAVTLAQVTSDNTTNTQINQNGNIAEITGGETRGSNLFHSFQDFSVPTGDEVAFDNANNISNIFSRVTGGNISNIDGVIRANGEASLFLINPAGIIFGENARLGLGGSFYGSTASSILFESGEFSAVDNLNQPLLTVTAPIGLGFRDNPGEIINRANFGLTEQTIIETDLDTDISTESLRITSISGLEVNRGNDIALIGGNIFLENSGITAPGGNVTLGGLSQAGEVGIDPDLSFEFPANLTKADVSLTNNALVSVASDGGGSIDIDVQNLSLVEESRLYAGIAEGIGSPDAVAGDIRINASESVSVIGNGVFEDPLTLDLNTSILNTVGLSPDRLNGEVSTSVGNGGSIEIDTDRLEVGGRAFIRNRLYGEGTLGDIAITGNTVILDNGAITNDVNLQAVGNSGNIAIDANSFDLTNSFVVSETRGRGNTGNVTVNVAENLEMRDFSIILAQVQFEAEGNAGDVTINAGNLNLFDSLILADSRGQGNAGNITLNVANDISLQSNDFGDGASEIVTGLGIPSGREDLDGDLANQDAIGNAGAIDIRAKNLSVLDGSQIFASTRDIGNGGNINIQLEESLSLERGGQIASQVGQGGVGNGGEINVTATSVVLNEFSFISTNAEAAGIGTAGNIILNTDNLRVTNASVIDARTENEFDGGSITVNANTVDLLSGGKIITVSNNRGNSGEIVFNVGGDLNISGSDAEFERRLTELSEIEEIDIDDRLPQFRFLISADILKNLGASSGLFANTTADATGNAGNIQLFTSEEVNLSDRGIISVEANGLGGAGTISLMSKNLNLDNSSLTASTTSGTGGNINLTIDETLSLNDSSSISAQAFNNADGGNLTIDTRFVVAFPNGDNDILASAEEGRGGNIDINVNSLFGITPRAIDPQTNDINASSTFNLDGTVNISNPDINPIQGMTQLTATTVKPEQTSAQACRANRDLATQSGLIVKGKGGQIADPALPLTSANVYIDGQLNSADVVSPPVVTAKGKIQPARGVRVTEEGNIILTAYSTNNAGERISVSSRNCGGA